MPGQFLQNDRLSLFVRRLNNLTALCDMFCILFTGKLDAVSGYHSFFDERFSFHCFNIITYSILHSNKSVDCRSCAIVQLLRVKIEQNLLRQ